MISAARSAPPETEPSPVRKRPPLALIIDEPEIATAEVDWSLWYLRDEDDMGDSFEHKQIIGLLLASLHQLARERGWQNRLWASDQFFAWRKDEPLVRISPDIYILDDAPPPPRPKSWQTWLEGHRPPAFAIEIVSDDWEKDYSDNPPKYAQLGCPELVIFDPDVFTEPRPNERRVPLQVYRRSADGAFACVYRGPGPLESVALGVHLVVRKEGPVARLRLAYDPKGKRLVPTTEEAQNRAEQKRGEAEQKRREAEQRLEEEAARRTAAEARVRDLEERLKKLGGG